MEMSVDELCKDLPPEFGIYTGYCRSLGFEDMPDYGYLRGLFREVAEREGQEAVFEWCCSELSQVDMDL